ncbi:T9SS C-terminal target domain-containing protein, partial [Dyadobacter subterraneus]
MDCDIVRGWAWDKNSPNNAVTVELVEGSTVYATAVANSYQEALKDAGIGTGNYGFNFALPASLKDGKSHQLSIRVQGSTVVLSSSPRTISCVSNLYSGRFEQASCNTISGWAWDMNSPGSALTVELVEGNVVYASA